MTEGDPSLPYRIIDTTRGCAYLEASLRLAGEVTHGQFAAYKTEAAAWRCGLENGLGSCGLYAVVERNPDLVEPDATIESPEQLTVARRDAHRKLHTTCPGMGLLSPEASDKDIVQRYTEMFDQVKGEPLPKRKPSTKPPEDQQDQQEE